MPRFLRLFWTYVQWPAMPLISDGFGPFSAPARAPWQTPQGLSAVLEGWQADPGTWRNVVLHERMPPEPAQFAQLPAALAAPVRRALAARGIDHIYSHQAEAFALSALGSDVVVATPTASGKSLCYNLPVLHALAQEPQGRALYLFPTKALARDQEVGLRALLADAGLEHGAITYDGDTPGDARRAARDRSGILLSNPDMLHAGILPHHASWARMFANLRYVVVDELHSYRGVFGSHLANVLRRLLRVACFHGADPRFVFASATIGNPEQHASRMLGRKVVLVSRSGAPKGPRRVMVYNPPVVNAELGIRASYLKTAVRLTTDLISAGVSTLVFGQSRNNIEVMLKYLREAMQRQKRDPRAVQSYRGGYLPDERRAIERALRDGEIRCVVATNALELGIDIGSLDAVVCAGYPGTISGLLQRFGRAGRRGFESLSLLVTSSAPLDQYLARAPEALLTAASEEARIDPDNVEILVQHVKCAAFELPFEAGERFGDVPPEVVTDALDFLGEHRLVHRVAGSAGSAVYHWSSDAYPANHVSLRSIGWDNFVIFDVEREAVIAEMDYRATHTMLHEQAIYQHGGEQFQVERLDFENHKAFVRKLDSDYFTDAMTHVRVSVLEQDKSALLVENVPHPMAAALGEVSVVEKVVGYKKIKYHTHENVGYGEVHLPEMQMHTSALWLTVPEAVVAAQPWSRAEVIDALRGLGNALHTVASVSLMVDPRDVGHTLGDRKADGAAPSKGGPGAPGFDPTLFVYDRMPGGVGLAPRLFEQRDELLARTLRLIQSCTCESGCPSCVGPLTGSSPAPAGQELPSRRRIALELLRDLGIALPH
jgi:DEAD/DEAH box helicase domain-containing protein